MLIVINTVVDEFFALFTKNIYQFLKVIIKQLNISRYDIYFFEYNDPRKQDNRTLVDVCLIQPMVATIK